MIYVLYNYWVNQIYMESSNPYLAYFRLILTS
jgi:hypothetical protein